MKLHKLESLISDLRLEFPDRIEAAEISININSVGESPELRWRFDISDLCVDRLYIWDKDK